MNNQRKKIDMPRRPPNVLLVMSDEHRADVAGWAGNKVGRTVEQNVSTCDLFATLCELAGLPVPEGLDSRSLVPFLEGGKPLHNGEVYSQYTKEQCMIKQDQLKYTLRRSHAPLPAPLGRVGPRARCGPELRQRRVPYQEHRKPTASDATSDVDIV